MVIIESCYEVSPGALLACSAVFPEQALPDKPAVAPEKALLPDACNTKAFDLFEYICQSLNELQSE